MLSYQEFAANIRRHDQLHLSGETKKRIQSLQPDQSCVICHQVQTPVIDKRFQCFWKWFYVIFPAVQFSSITYRYFILYVNQFNCPLEIIQRLILTIRYSEPVYFKKFFKKPQKPLKFIIILYLILLTLI